METEQVAAFVAPGMKRALIARAEHEGVNMSTIIRWALMHYMHIDLHGRTVDYRPLGGRDDAV